MPDIKLLLITNLFPNPQEPLRGIFVYNIAKELRKKCALTVISPLPWVPKILSIFARFRRFALVPNEFEIDGIKVYSPKYLAVPKLGFMHPVFIFLSVFSLVRRLKKENKTFLINTQCVFPDGVAVSWIAGLLKLPHVLTALGTDVNEYSTYKLRRPQIVKALKSAEQITVVSKAQKELISKLGIEGAKVSVIKNGVDLQGFNLKDKRECRNRLGGIKPDGKIILFVGRMTHVKGLNYLIDAVDLLRRCGKDDYVLIVIGEGELRLQYEKEVIDKSLGNNIYFMGEKSREELPVWYGACDVLCLPSLMEGCPNVLLEAIACGRPVVASKVGGIPDLVTQNNGRLFEAGNAQELAKALAEVLQADWNAREVRSSIEGYTWENAAENYLCACYAAFSKAGDD